MNGRLKCGNVPGGRNCRNFLLKIFKGNLIVTVYRISKSRVVKVGLRDDTSVGIAVKTLVPFFSLFHGYQRTTQIVVHMKKK